VGGLEGLEEEAPHHRVGSHHDGETHVREEERGNFFSATFALVSHMTSAAVWVANIELSEACGFN